MKKMKKVLAMLLAMAMVLGMSVTSLAANKPTEEDSKLVDIRNVDEGATFKAYQIIDADYNDNGFVGYVWAEGTGKTGKITFTNGKVDGLTDELITGLAADPSKLEIKNENFDPYNDELAAGTWMILVTPPADNATKIYNPMIVSVYYNVSGSSNEMGSDPVDAAADWTLETTDAFAKSSEIRFDKKLDNPELDTEVKVGDSVPYTITSEIPSYDPTYYSEPVFTITDEIVNGLKYDGEPKVYGGTLAEPAEGQTFDEANEGKLLKKDTDYTLIYDQNKSFKVSFTKKYIQDLVSASKDARKVTVKYTATVLDSAVTKVGENKATLEFSRTPGEDTAAKKEDKEYIFTFALHGVFFKVDENDTLLDKCEFTLYVEDEKGTETIKWADGDEKKASVVGNPYSTTEDGEIKFKGLDGDKVYYLRETKAHDGYSINDTIYKIVFDFNKADEYAGENTTYKVTVTNNKDAQSKEYTVIYGETVTDVYGNTASGEITKVQNTKISSLPSTGGIGTTIFTIGGCAIMIIAAGLYFASRRKRTEK